MNSKECESLSDEELVIRSLVGADHFECLVQRYDQALLRYVKRLSGLPEHDCEDIVQESFIKIFRNLNDFDVKLKFSSWAYRITHNHTLNELKKRQNNLLGKDQDSQLDLAKSLSLEISPDNSLEKEELQKILSNCLEKASADQKGVMLLHYWEDKNYEEISDILRMPIGSVGTHLARGKEQIKKCLGRTK